MGGHYHGQRIKVTGSVGDDASGNLKGETGSVLGVNATFTNQSGVDMVNVRLDNGAVVAVPAKALKETRK